MRAADNPVGHHDRTGSVSLEEGQNLITDGRIATHVRVALGDAPSMRCGIVSSTTLERETIKLKLLQDDYNAEDDR